MNDHPLAGGIQLPMERMASNRRWNGLSSDSEKNPVC